MFKFIVYLLQSILIYIFFLFGKIVGLKLSRKIFAIIFSFFGPMFKSKDILSKNLEKFLNVSPNFNKDKITQEMWKNYGMVFIEYIFLNNFRRSNSHITIHGKEKFIDILKNKPVIFISGHFSNFELMSMELTKMGVKLATIYRPLNNIFLNPLMEFLRRRYVCKNQIKKGINGVRDSINFIKKNYSVALMIDQRVSEGEKINLFGHKALTTTLPAQLAKKFDLNIVPVFIERTQENNFKIEFKEPLDVKKFKSKMEVSEELNKILEKMIVKNPYQWIWTHNRWK